MATDGPLERGADGPPDDFQAFVNLLNELKATGCALLVVGDTSRDLFTRASGQLLGDADVLRHRVLAVTDATPTSVAERLPDPAETPRPLTETTRVVNHAEAPRSVTAATSPDTPPELAGIEEVRIADPELTGLQSALCQAIDDVRADAARLKPADLRVGIDSLAPLLDHYDVEVVATCLDAVGDRVRAHDAMAHYVLPRDYDADAVQALVPHVDAVVELRAVDPGAYGHDAQQRWRVPRENVETEWTPL
ncbi:DUF7504 family protein [Halorussus halobius]|uniref:DUF7504 family protein n=1 Tax=Halorussus halobius TaxID=1710537 RepID=UPI0010918CC1|nr:hypothetical protein [Halorussus halobius]